MVVNFLVPPSGDRTNVMGVPQLISIKFLFH